MTQPSKLMIGTLAGGVAGMDVVEDLVATNQGIRTWSIQITPAHYSRFIKLGDGTIQAQGYKQAEWHLNGIRDAHWQALYAFRTAQSTELFIRTLSEDGKTFKNYQCLMHWASAPPTRDYTTNVVLDFNIEFTHMVEFADI